MKAISLWQPWATLVAMGAKQYETRHWWTSHRGPLLIHAAKRWTKDEVLAWAKFSYRLGSPAVIPPLGAIICLVRLVDCIPTEQLVSKLSKQEIAFGNYDPGRYAWKLELLRSFEPIPFKGAQGFWEYAGELPGVETPKVIKPANEQMTLF